MKLIQKAARFFGAVTLAVGLQAVGLQGQALAQTESEIRSVDIAPSQAVLGPSAITPTSPDTQNPALAEELYKQGHDALAAKDNEKAMTAFVASCTAGSGKSCFNVGLFLDEKPDEALGKAADYYQRACNLDFQRACSVYGRFMSTGTADVSQDQVKAAALFRGACDANDAGGCHGLADATYKGEGVTKNLSDAAALYKRACELGAVGDSCFNYGLMREKGMGVDADTTEAIDYYRKACQRKSASGCTNLAIGYAQGDGLPQDKELATSFFSEGCKSGDVIACNNLAYVTRTGEGVPKDSKKAAALYRASCDKGDGAGCLGLGQMAMDSEPGAGGKAKAYPLFVKGCELNNARSCYNAGFTRWIGWGTGDNLEEGFRWFTRGCELNDASSCGGAAMLVTSSARGEDATPRPLSAEELAEAHKWLDKGKRINPDDELVKAVEAWLVRPGDKVGNVSVEK